MSVLDHTATDAPPEPPEAFTAPPFISAHPVPATGLVFILSGPSGVGKSALIDRLKRERFPITYCITATTRPRRAGEQVGVHYYFLRDEQFHQLLRRGELLEHALVHQEHHYGIPLSSVREGLRRGQDLIMTPEVQGAATVRSKLPNAISIFLLPPSIEELIPRLEARGTETPEQRKRRLETAEREMAHVGEYDYVVVNHRDRLDDAVEDVKAIIGAERGRTPRRLITL